jgi:hypothetical protein
MAADDVDGEGDVLACEHAHEVDKAKYGTEYLVVSRREGGLIGRRGGVDITVLDLRHGESGGIGVKHPMFLEELCSVLFLIQANVAILPTVRSHEMSMPRMEMARPKSAMLNL